jgi:kinesin family protein C2/C3
LTVFINALNTTTQSVTSAKLHLIDLAGSERVKNSGVEGDRLKEATHINTSLTHLKTVISALANKSAHVAYRNSTLTSMLQDSLGGNCKCLMFANISAATFNVPESICTMKYAAEARKVEIGKVTANVKKTASTK